MHLLTLLFFVFLAAGTAFRLWLSARQIRAMRDNRAAVPAPFDNQISIDDHQKAADYTAESTRFGMLDTIIDAVLLLLWTVGGGIALLDRTWAAMGWSPLRYGCRTGFRSWMIENKDPVIRLLRAASHSRGLYISG